MGRRVTFTCSAYQGNEVQFSWTRNGKILQSGQKFVVVTSAESSMLTVKAVSSEDSGNYTCIASNPFSEDRSTAFLLIEGCNVFS